MVEIYPFWKLSWRSREIQERWAPLRNRIYNATAFAEYEMVKRGFRDANVYQLDPGKFDIQIDKVLRDGLGYRPILRSKQYKGYGHRHYPTDTIDKDTFIYGVVGRTQEQADKFWKANQGSVDHTTIGRMLGYPECFAKETKIQTSEGLLNIEDVKEGAVLIDGSMVMKTMKKQYNGKLISLKVQGLPLVKITPDHEILVARSHTGWKWGELKTPEWKQAKDLTKNDRVLIKKLEYPEINIIIDFDKYLKIKKDKGRWRFHEGNNDGVLVKSSRTIPNISGCYNFDKDFAYLVGWYLAEGCSSIEKAQVSFSVANEKEANIIGDLIEKIFAIKPRIKKKPTAYVVTVYSLALARYFREFGHRAPNKKLPPYSWCLKKEVLKRLIQGFVDGDGWETSEKICIHIASENIIKEMQLLLLLRFGKFSSYSKKKRAGKSLIQRRIVNVHDAHILNITKNNKNNFFMENAEFIALKVKSVIPCNYSGYVYNFETDTNVYGVPFIVHNCDIEFFNSVWLKEGNLDPMYEVALNTEGVDVDGDTITVSGHHYLNRLIRYFGFNLIPHFAHSFDCKEAIKFAETWLTLMKEYDEEASEACIGALNQPMVWSLSNCITYIDHPLFIGAANGYYTPKKKTVKWLPSA